ncbi:hypothetical protein NLU13_5655 [Sarocladium strictum]|uniref:Uncharacterized protein n=1 Tax=Sarocladium strictum TaxID=5046 RepID=A0AA39GJT8_SARSR|nr:hypothetical protein NLU13_5655 [Sarocladium strictum]
MDSKEIILNGNATTEFCSPVQAFFQSTVNDFLGTGPRIDSKFKENQPISHAMTTRAPVPAKGAFTDTSGAFNAAQVSREQPVREEEPSHVLQPPVPTLINLMDELDVDSESGDEDVALPGVSEVNHLLDIARSSIPALIEGKYEEIPYDLGRQQALRTILGGLVMLRKSMQSSEIRKPTLHHQAVAASSSMADLMELVDSKNPTGLRYSSQELEELRNFGKLRPGALAAVEETKKELEAFAAIRKRSKGTRGVDDPRKIEAHASLADDLRGVMHAPVQRSQEVEDEPSGAKSLGAASSKSDETFESLTQKAAEWTLKEAPTVPGLARSYWAPDNSKPQSPLFVLPPKASSAVEIKPDTSQVVQQTLPNADVPDRTIEEIMRALALLDAAEEKKKRPNQDQETPKSPVSATKTPVRRKGLASSMWA